MAQNYVRQSTFADGDTINASLFNNEYNQLENSFTYSSTSAANTGHRHDGTAGEGGNIFKIGDLDFLNKIEVDSANNRWGFYVEVSSAAVEQIRIQDGGVVPVTTNDIDLGTPSLQFKNLYVAGTASIDSLTLTSGSTVTTILDEDDMSSNSATALATQQSIKAYVDAQDTAQDLDFQGDTGGALSIDLDAETFTVAGGTGIDTAGSANTLTVNIDSTVTTLTGTQTLTNKTLTSPDVNGGTIDSAVIGGTAPAAGSFTTVSVTGDITVNGNVDGRDVAADGTKLDGVESGATADQTAAEIRQLVETATDSNVFTDADHSKLNGIEPNATEDQTASEIRALVEAATDSNVFTDADHTKLNSVESNADVTDATNVQAAGALMDSEVTNLAQVKAFDSGDYATAAQGTLASSALQDVVDDLTPQLGGNLDVNGNSIVSVANGNIAIAPNGTGKVVLDGISFPTADGTSGQTLVTDGAGNLSFASAGTGTLNNIVEDTTPQLGGNLNLNGNNIVSSGSERIGIGTTSPLHEVHINSASPQIRLAESDGTNVVADIQLNGSALSFDARNGTDNGIIRFRGLGNNVVTEYARFTSAGRLGIGVANPSEKLDVQAATDPSIRVRSTGTASTDDAFMRIEVAGTTASSYLMFGDATNSGTGRIRYVHSDDSMRIYAGEVTERIRMYSASIQFRDNSSEFARFDSSGNFGIGTSSPARALHVSIGTDNEGIRLSSTDTYALYEAIDDGGSVAFGAVQGEFHVRVAGANQFQIESDGTTVARGSDASLTVDNQAGAPDKILAIFQADMGTNDRNFQIKSPTTDSNAAPFRFVTSNSFAFEIDAVSTLALADNKYVGIGDEDPIDRLTVSRLGATWTGVAPNANTTALLHPGTTNATSGSALTIAANASSASTLYFSSDTDNDVGFIAYDHSDNSMQFRTNGGERLRVTSVGRVGIGTSANLNDQLTVGTSSDAFTASVSGAVTTMRLGAHQTGSAAGRFDYDRSNGTLTYKEGSYDSEGDALLAIDSSGRLGLGTTTLTDSYKMIIEGSDQETANLTDSGTHGATLFVRATGEGVGSGGAVAFGTTNSNRRPFAAIKGYVNDGTANSVGDLTFSTRATTSATNLTERMRLTQSGRLVVGVNTAQGKLDVQSDGQYTPAAYFRNDGNTASWARADWYNDQASGSGIIYRDQAGTFVFRNDNSSGTATTTAIVAGSTTAGHIVFNTTASSEAMRVESSGEVGIGTPTPAAKLHVYTATTNTIVKSHSGSGYGAFQAHSSGTNPSYIFFNNGTGERGRITVTDSGEMLFYRAGTVENARFRSTGVLRLERSLAEHSTALSGSGTVQINYRLGNNFTHTLSGNTTYTFVTPESSGYVSAITLKVTQDSTARTITWPSSVDWAGGTAPTLSTGSGDVDVFVFVTYDGGTTYYGFTAGQDMQ